MASVAAGASVLSTSKKQRKTLKPLIPTTSTKTASATRKDTPATLEIKPVYPSTPFHSRRGSPEPPGLDPDQDQPKKMSKKWNFFIRKPPEEQQNNNNNGKEEVTKDESKFKVESWNMSNLLKSTLMTKDILENKDDAITKEDTKDDSTKGWCPEHAVTKLFIFSLYSLIKAISSIKMHMTINTSSNIGRTVCWGYVRDLLRLYYKNFVYRWGSVQS